MDHTCTVCSTPKKSVLLVPLGFEDPEGRFVNLGQFLCRKCGRIFEEEVVVSTVDTGNKIEVKLSECMSPKAEKKKTKTPKPARIIRKTAEPAEDGSVGTLLTGAKIMLDKSSGGRPKCVVDDPLFECTEENGCYQSYRKAAKNTVGQQQVKRVVLPDESLGHVIYYPPGAEPPEPPEKEDE